MELLLLFFTAIKLNEMLLYDAKTCYYSGDTSQVDGFC